MIIGLVGWIGSGKGTVADTLIREHGYHKFAFADALKDAVATIFSWPRGLLEGDSNASRAFRERIDPWWSHKFGYEVTPRLILQRMGTEACRHGIHDDIWIHTLAHRIKGYDDVVIADVRFPNEIQFIMGAGGKIVHVERGEKPTHEEIQKMHLSETAWIGTPFHYELDNNGNKDQLKERVAAMLTRLEDPNIIMHHQV